jgi:2-amino-4-hydroxy-6-hydroxymethyldihydropteridine diphosphokinase
MILIGLGANLPAPDGSPPLGTVQKAVTQLGTLPGLRLCGVSRLYLSEPIPPSAQPLYVNAVAALEISPGAGEPDPLRLLRWLQRIEVDAGRVRGEPNAARTLDLDIIAMGPAGGAVRIAPDPVLPHPRAHLRAFVLIPLLDVAPDWVHPILRRSAAELLRDLPRQGVSALSSAGQ